jgi:hypothetical protein
MVINLLVILYMGAYWGQLFCFIFQNVNLILSNTNFILGNTNLILSNTNFILGNTNLNLGNTNFILESTNLNLGNTNLILGTTNFIGVISDINTNLWGRLVFLNLS